MAESMCGPSNALQNFQKHSTVDRTLQQDRLVSRNPQGQSFRSSPGPNGGLADREFESFQAGQVPLDHGYQPQGMLNAPQRFQQAQSFQQAGPSGWASDFQQLHISSPAPQFQQQPFNPQVQQRQNGAGWHEEFARQQGQQSHMGQMPNQMGPQFRPMGGMNMTPQYIGGYPQPQANMSMVQQTQQPAEASDEAFARAFEEAERAAFDEAERAASVIGQEQNMEMGQDILINESAERLMRDSTEVLDQKRIGADTIHDHRDQSPEAREQNDDPNALSKTAGQLLQSVQREQSSKFQNSQFLELMRAFRDKEATVDGDKVVGTGIGSGMSNDALKPRMDELANLIEVTHFEESWHPYKKSQTIPSVFLKLFEIYQLESLVDLEGGPIKRHDAPQFWSDDIAEDFCVPRHEINPVNAAAIAEIDISSLSLSQNAELDREPRLAYDYITSLLSNPEEREAHLLTVLPYTLNNKSQLSAETMHVHLALARGSLGKDVEDVEEWCRERGIFGDIGLNRFSSLVSMKQRCGSEGVEYRDALEKTERSIELIMEARALDFVDKEAGVGLWYE